MSETDYKVEFQLDRNHFEVIYYPHGIETDPVFVCLNKKISHYEYDRYNNCPDCGHSLVNCWKIKTMIIPRKTDKEKGRGGTS